MECLKNIYWELSSNDEKSEQELLTAKRISKLHLKEIIIYFKDFSKKDSFCKKLISILKDVDANVIFKGELSVSLFLLIVEICNSQYIKNFKFILQNREMNICYFEEIKNLGIDISTILIELCLNKKNYKGTSDFINKVQLLGYKECNLYVKQYGEDRVIPEKMFDVICELSKLRNYANNITINFMSIETMIKEKLEHKNISDMYIDSNKNVGVFYFLPTYSESERNHNLIELWKTYIQFFFQQDINFITDAALLKEEIPNKQKMKELSMKYEKFFLQIPKMNKNYKIVEKGEQYTIFDEKDCFIVQIDYLGKKIIDYIDGINTIYEIINKIVSEEKIMKQIGHSGITIFIKGLYANKILY